MQTQKEEGREGEGRRGRGRETENTIEPMHCQIVMRRRVVTRWRWAMQGKLVLLGELVMMERCE